MKAAAASLLKVLERKMQFIIPIYQRTYSWELTDCQQLWNDVLNAGLNDSIVTHFFGSIVYVGSESFHTTSTTKLLLIDGQQRLTTLFLLFAASREASSGKEQLSEETQQKLCNTYLFNPDESDDTRYKLLLTQSDRETLIQILEGGEEPYPVSTRIQQNYEFFKRKISRSSINPLTIYKGISKLTVVDLALEPQDNPQLIFEGLNATGVALSQADLIRNYVLMKLDAREQIKLYKCYWYPMEQRFGSAQNAPLFNRFMRDYLTIRSKTGEIPNIDKIYATFKSYQQSQSATSISELVADIHQYSKYFTNIDLLKEKDSMVRQLFSSINTLQVNVTYPFLLQVYDDYEKEQLSKQDFCAILKLIESYVFRRAVCGIPTNSLNKVFATLAREIDKNHYLESVKAAFLQKAGNSRFPGDEEFRAEFVVKDVYNFRHRNYLLNKLENYRQKEKVIIEECTIEHIMPQNERLSNAWRKELGPDWKKIQAQYLHTIGNLTLTGYNLQLSDRPFLEKRNYPDGGFKDSLLRLNRGLADLDHWNEEEITKRARGLADMAVKIWPMPELVEQSNGLDTKKQKVALEAVPEPLPPVIAIYTIESHLTHIPFDIRGIFERLRRRILNLDSSVREEVEKHSITYTATTNFVAIEPQKKKLVLTLNVGMSEINDPQGLCRSIAENDYHFGGDVVEIHVNSLSQIEEVLHLVQQAFEKQSEEVYT